MKKPIALILCLVMLMAVGFTACSSDEKKDDNKTDVEETEDKDEDSDSSESEVAIPDTLGGSIYSEFLNVLEDETDVNEIAAALATEEVTGYNCMSMEVSEGLLNGFTSEITGFNSGAVFSPVIGSVPFVGYVFETDDTLALKDTLLSNADPRWNICTEADETFCESSGNYVFFVMCPNE